MASTFSCDIRTLLDTSAVVAAPKRAARVPRAAIRLRRGNIGPRALRRTARRDYAAAVLVPRGSGQQAGWKVTTHRAAHAHAPPIRAVPERVQRFQHVIALVHVRLQWRPCIHTNKQTNIQASGQLHRLSALRTCLLVSKFAEPTAHGVFGSVHAPLPKGAPLHPAPVSPAVCSCHVGNERSRGAKTAHTCEDLKRKTRIKCAPGL